MKWTGTAPRRGVAAIVSMAMLVSGCATTQPLVTPGAVGPWRTVDLAIDVIEPVPKAGPQSATPVIGATSGAALGVGLLVSLALFAMEKSAAEEATRQEARMQPLIADIDLRAAFQAEMLAHASPTWRRLLRPSALKLPAPVPGQTWDEALKGAAAQGEGDALLAVRIWPHFRSKYVHPGVTVQAQLRDRRGTLLQSDEFVFLAPSMLSMETEERMKWWEDGRWRRFVLQGLQATAIGLAARVEPRDDAQAREDRFVDMMARDAHLQIESARHRSSVCSLSGDGKPLVHRFERMWKEIRVGTVCADEDAARVAAGASPLISWAVPAVERPPVIARP